MLPVSFITVLSTEIDNTDATSEFLSTFEVKKASGIIESDCKVLKVVLVTDDELAWMIGMIAAVVLKRE